MSTPQTAPRVPDFHKSAFWIYGVTAMVMREPLSVVLHHAATAGWQNTGVQLEALRGLVVWLVMSRQFTVAGIYFDRVYLQPDSATRFPRRSYPHDFIVGIGALLAAVGASTVVGSNSNIFDYVIGVALSWDLLWLAIAAAARHSSVPVMASGVAWKIGILALFAAALAAFGELPAYCVLLVGLLVHMGRLIADYDRLYSTTGATEPRGT